MMKTTLSGKQRAVMWRAPGALLALLMLQPSPAHASIFKGEALDKAADVLTWIVLIIAPIIAIAAFWLVHILPEKIAEKKKHPQVKAIQCLCLLSLAFGGMLWPIAWLWAYTKPVLHQMAYGTDVAGELAHEKKELQKTENEVEQLSSRLAELEKEELKKAEIEAVQLRHRLAEIEARLAGKSATDGRKA